MRLLVVFPTHVFCLQLDGHDTLSNLKEQLGLEAKHFYFIWKAKRLGRMQDKCALNACQITSGSQLWIVQKENNDNGDLRRWSMLRQFGQLRSWAVLIFVNVESFSAALWNVYKDTTRNQMKSMKSMKRTARVKTCGNRKREISSLQASVGDLPSWQFQKLLTYIQISPMKSSWNLTQW